MRQLGESKEEISRRSFLKLGFGGILVAVPLLSGCLGEEEEEEEEEEEDDGRRRRRRRR